MRTTKQQLLELVRELAVGREPEPPTPHDLMKAFNLIAELAAKMKAWVEQQEEDHELLYEQVTDLAGLLNRIVELERRQQDIHQRLGITTNLVNDLIPRVGELENDRQATGKYITGASNLVAGRVEEFRKELGRIEEQFAYRTAEDERRINQLSEQVDALKYIVKHDTPQVAGAVPHGPTVHAFDSHMKEDGATVEATDEAYADEPQRRPHHNTKLINVSAFSARTQSMLDAAGFVNVADLDRFVKNHDNDPDRLHEVEPLDNHAVAEITAVLY